LYPEQASNFAPQVDGLVLFMIAVCAFFAVVICAAVIYFFFQIPPQNIPTKWGVPIHGDMRLEIAWIVLPFFLLMAMFGWGAVIYVDYRHTPSDTLDIYVSGKHGCGSLQQP
jgi:cytochrome c oxidase subunit 2